MASKLNCSTIFEQILAQMAPDNIKRNVNTLTIILKAELKCIVPKAKLKANGKG